MLTTDKQARKEQPIARGFLDYFPDAAAAVANVSYVANEQHNPGEPMHWAKGKSNDHADSLVRHLIERGTVDTDGLRHSAKAAWRAMALLQTELEAAQAEPVTDQMLARDRARDIEVLHGLHEVTLGEPGTPGHKTIYVYDREAWSDDDAEAIFQAKDGEAVLVDLPKPKFILEDEYAHARETQQRWVDMENLDTLPDRNGFPACLLTDNQDYPENAQVRYDGPGQEIQISYGAGELWGDYDRPSLWQRAKRFIAGTLVALAIELDPVAVGDTRDTY